MSAGRVCLAYFAEVINLNPVISSRVDRIAIAMVLQVLTPLRSSSGSSSSRREEGSDQSPKKPWSQGENLVHTSFQSGVLVSHKNTFVTNKHWKAQTSQHGKEKPELEPLADLWTRTVGYPVKLEVGRETTTGSLELFKAVNKIGHDHGVGRVDIVESRFIGLKNRGCYDTPGLTILRLAHIEIEGLTLDSNVRRLRDQFVTTEWSRCLYNGMYFSPERNPNYVIGRSSEASNLYSETKASMDTPEGFSPEDTSLKKYGAQKITDGEPLIKN
ncbi:hypothetical protein F4824DRAFT_493558 [Ustulina deusta]|nr:hypothetical protein F4824DRAFT_493558 [Ustulina deusta]